MSMITTKDGTQIYYKETSSGKLAGLCGTYRDIQEEGGRNRIRTILKRKDLRNTALDARQCPHQQAV